MGHPQHFRTPRLRTSGLNGRTICYLTFTPLVLKTGPRYQIQTQCGREDDSNNENCSQGPSASDCGLRFSATTQPFERILYRVLRSNRTYSWPRARSLVTNYIHVSTSPARGAEASILFAISPQQIWHRDQTSTRHWRRERQCDSSHNQRL